jgi:hypothetical protein
MRLSHPFKSARDLNPDPMGRIAIVDADGVVLTHVTLDVAHEIADNRSGHGSGDNYSECYTSGYGYGGGYGYSDSRGEGYGCGSGYGISHGGGGWWRR